MCQVPSEQSSLPLNMNSITIIYPLFNVHATRNTRTQSNIQTVSFDFKIIVTDKRTVSTLFYKMQDTEFLYC